MKKTFDCVEMKRKGSQAVYEALRGKSRDEQVEYWRGRNEDLHRWLQTHKRNTARSRVDV